MLSVPDGFQNKKRNIEVKDRIMPYKNNISGRPYIARFDRNVTMYFKTTVKLENLRETLQGKINYCLDTY